MMFASMLAAAWRYRRLAALVLGVISIGILGLYIWGLRATVSGQAETIAAKQIVIEQKQAEINGAVATNKANMAAFDKYKADRDAADAVAAADAAATKDRDAAVAEIHQGIAHVQPKPGMASSSMPYSNDALRRLRDLKATRAAGHHADPAGTDAGPSPAAGVQSRP